MNIALWVLQFMLALAFLAHGWMFLSPPPELIDQMNASIAPAFRLFIGVAEVLAAIGLTLPGMTRVLPGLVPAAAAGLVIVMISATIFHVARAEYTSAAMTFLLLVLAAFVAYMRWKVMSIPPRGASARPRVESHVH